MPDNKPLTGYPSIDKPWLKYYSAEALKAPLPEDTIYEHVLKCSIDHMDRTAINYFGRQITYKEIFVRSALQHLHWLILELKKAMPYRKG